MSTTDAWIWGVVAGEWLGIIAMAHLLETESESSAKKLFVLYSAFAGIVMFGGAMAIHALKGLGR